MVSVMYAQPILLNTSLETGQNFNLYYVGNASAGELLTSGADVTWNLSDTENILAGTAELLAMEDTPYAAEYPNANFAIRITPIGDVPRYSLFNLNGTVYEEVANNVGTSDATSFINPRSSLFFPFTFNSTQIDAYQKSGQGMKEISLFYDAYGTLITNTATYTNVVRNYMQDDGTNSYLYWNTNPMAPLFQVSSQGFILWISTTPTGLKETASKTDLSVYPNPAKAELKIISKGSINKVEVINEAGQVQFTSKETTLDVSLLNPGTYFIKAYTADGVVSQKFIKE
jgi:hypothetical protein